MPSSWNEVHSRNFIRYSNKLIPSLRNNHNADYYLSNKFNSNSFITDENGRSTLNSEKNPSAFATPIGSANGTSTKLKSASRFKTGKAAVSFGDFSSIAFHSSSFKDGLFLEKNDGNHKVNHFFPKIEQKSILKKDNNTRICKNSDERSLIAIDEMFNDNDDTDIQELVAKNAVEKPESFLESLSKLSLRADYNKSFNSFSSLTLYASQPTTKGFKRLLINEGPLSGINMKSKSSFSSNFNSESFAGYSSNTRIRKDKTELLIQSNNLQMKKRVHFVKC